jgi:hypothetical protein
MKPIAFDVNCAKKFNQVPPVMERRLKEYKLLQEALEYKDE